METFSFINYFLAMFLVVGLIVTVFWFVSKSNLFAGKLFMQNRPDKRLKIKEVLALDTRRRVMIIERDDAEFTLLISPTGDRVIETNITSSDQNKSFKSALQHMNDKAESDD